MKTITVNPKTVSRKWKLVDAADKPMGRVASEVARLLMGKHKAIYSPNVDTVVDAADKPMGRVASEVARLLMGKHKAIYSPNVDTGDFVVVINAEKVAVSGNKALQKQYFHHTGHIAGERWINFADLLAKNPTAPLEAAIWGMLPHSALGHKMIKKLKIFAGAEHPFAAQKPEVVEL